MRIPKSLKYEIFKRDSFTCQYCGGQTPQVILKIDYISPSGDKNDKTNLITSCFNCSGKKQAVPINEKREQIDAYEASLIEHEESKVEVLQELNEYWSSLCDNEYSLNESGLESLSAFLENLVPFEIKESMKIAAKKIPANDMGNRFKYFCGICHNKIRAKSGDTSSKTFNEVKRYYLSKPRGGGYYNKEQLREFCRLYPEEDLIRAIDIAFSESRPSYWRAFCEALEELTGDELEY